MRRTYYVSKWYCSCGCGSVSEVESDTLEDARKKAGTSGTIFRVTETRERVPVARKRRLP